MTLLTIYIPSFNRSSLLLKQLNSISKSKNLDQVKIEISDNNSNDIGYKEVELFCRENSIFYKKNFFNDKGNPNIFNGFLSSFSTKYLWILSDNDLLRNDSIDKILEILKNEKFDVFLFTHDKNEKLSISEFNQERLLKECFLVSSGIGLISNVIYRTDFIKEHIFIGYDFIFSGFPHLSIIIKSFHKKKGIMAVINKNIFFQKEELSSVNFDKYGYARSYYGFIFLAELFEPKQKKLFIKSFSKFWNLRHWIHFKKSPNVFFNEVLAYGYLSRYSNLFRMKIFLWKIMYFFITLLKLK